MAGGKQRVLRGDVLPFFTHFAGRVGTPLPPSGVAAPGNSGPDPTEHCQGQPRRILVLGFDKWTHTPTGGCGALEGIIAIWTYSARMGGGQSHRTQDLWGQFMRSAPGLSPSVPWKTKGHCPFF